MRVYLNSARLGIFFSASIVLAACGGPKPDGRIVSLCVTSGEQTEFCECVAKSFQKNLSESDIETYYDIADEIQEMEASGLSGEEQAEMIMNMSEEQMQVMSRVDEQYEVAKSVCAK